MVWRQWWWSIESAGDDKREEEDESNSLLSCLDHDVAGFMGANIQKMGHFWHAQTGFGHINQPRRVVVPLSLSSFPFPTETIKYKHYSTGNGGLLIHNTPFMVVE